MNRHSAGKLAQAVAALGIALSAVAAMPAAAEDKPTAPEANKTDTATPGSKDAQSSKDAHTEEGKASNPCAVKKKKKKKGPCAVGG